jgi:hypothetical protein
MNVNDHDQFQNDIYMLNKNALHLAREIARSEPLKSPAYLGVNVFEARRIAELSAEQLEKIARCGRLVYSVPSLSESIKQEHTSLPPTQLASMLSM